MVLPPRVPYAFAVRLARATSSSGRGDRGRAVFGTAEASGAAARKGVSSSTTTTTTTRAVLPIGMNMMTSSSPRTAARGTASSPLLGTPTPAPAPPWLRHFRGLSTTSTSSSSGRTTNAKNRPGQQREPHAHDEGEEPQEGDNLAGLFKNPIVQQLWKARQQAKALSKQSNKTKKTKTKGPVAVPVGKSPQESQVSVTYQFGTDTFLREAYRNPWGQMRLGRLMEDLDALAGNIAYFHVSPPKPVSPVDAAGEAEKHDETEEEEEANDDDRETDVSVDDDINPIIVTASVDRIQLRRPVPDMSKDQELSGCVTWTGTSSMEIRMQCAEASTVGGESRSPWLVAYVTFVTLHPQTHRPMAIAPLVASSPLELQRYEGGARRAALKKLKRQRKGPPARAKKSGNGDSDNNYENENELEELAESLLQEAGPLLTLPSLADPHSILMAQTKMQNAQVAQPQVQNLHRRIFGGFLLRRAFELGFANAYLFGGALPLFLEVDEVSFQSPVDVGDLLVFNSRVLYTEPDGARLSEYYQQEGHESTTTTATTSTSSSIPSSRLPVVHVEVECWVTEPEKAQARLSNQFYFTFAVRSSTSASTTSTSTTTTPNGNGNNGATAVLPPIRKVLPSNIDEARRMASRMLGDREQHREQQHREQQPHQPQHPA